VDTTTGIVIAIALFALIAVAYLFVFRKQGKMNIDTPLGKLNIEGSNQPEQTIAAPLPGVSVKGAKSHSGGLLAEDRTGRGAQAEDVEVETDILISSENPADKADPKV
jgi:hypothetical protein